MLLYRINLKYARAPDFRFKGNGRAGENPESDLTRSLRIVFREMADGHEPQGAFGNGALPRGVKSSLACLDSGEKISPGKDHVKAGNALAMKHLRQFQ